MLTPYFFSFVTCCFLTLGSYLSRFSKVAGYPPIQYSLDFSIVAGFWYLLGFIYQHFFVQPYPMNCILTMILAGYSILGAFLFLIAAVLQGKGGLAIALTQTQSFFWLLLEMVFSFRIPSIYEGVSIAFGITGAAIITFAKK